jgi:5-oxoprolinase (ATP-hydrolysing)
MGVADLRALRQASVEAPLDTTTLAALPARAATLAADARAALAAQHAGTREHHIVRRMQIRITGSDTSLSVPWPSDAKASTLAAAFHTAHARHFGFRVHDDARLVVESLEVEAVAAGSSTATTAALPSEAPAPAPRPVAVRRMHVANAWRDVPVYERAALAPGAALAGPALIVEANATTVLGEQWRAAVDGAGCLVLTRAAPRAGREAVSASADPIMLEVFNHSFMHVAEEMGVVLASTAHSVNIKERLDFSCALFDAAGDLIANAPHIPVHLGSMGDSVQSILRDRRTELVPGSAFMLNTPYNGGTHLPDVTVVTPVFGASGALEFVVASRAHHADVGGVTPGSMPPHSRSIDEEGVLLDGVQIVASGRFLEARVRELFCAGRYPARNPDRNVADLQAQLAANARGVAELERLVDRFGSNVVHAYMRHVQDNAEECVRAAIERLHDGSFAVELDGGEQIAVAIRVDRRARAATIDFTGSSGASPTNFNAPSAIVRAAVLYVFRTLVRESIPLNAGCLRPLTIVVPRPSLLAPEYPAAVVAGNVETSQCITDALLAALGVCAAAQGTMNNFTFGGTEHQYYETICGGAGAGPGFAGASAVHTHMTNSRLTDIEVLERRYPVRVRRFAIRKASGGAGRYRGGDGVVRDIEFRAPLQAAILANRRRTAPFGLAGGGAGARGKNYVVRANGAVEELPATAEVALAPGDRFVIETPGGGGYGQ